MVLLRVLENLEWLHKYKVTRRRGGSPHNHLADLRLGASRVPPQRPAVHPSKGDLARLLFLRRQALRVSTVVGDQTSVF
eukprot:4145051-Pleurochrysis_carterae.AAC.1